MFIITKHFTQLSNPVSRSSPCLIRLHQPITTSLRPSAIATSTRQSSFFLPYVYTEFSRKNLCLGIIRVIYGFVPDWTLSLLYNEPLSEWTCTSSHSLNKHCRATYFPTNSTVSHRRIHFVMFCIRSRQGENEGS